MNIWNKRYKEKGRKAVKKYLEARQEGFCVEALALANNILKANLTVALEMEYQKRGKKKGNIKKVLKPGKDVGSLIKLSKDIKLFSQKEIEELEDFWNARNRTLHNYIDGEIKYKEVCEVVKQFGEIMKFVQGSWLSIKVGPVEKL